MVSYRFRSVLLVILAAAVLSACSGSGTVPTAEPTLVATEPPATEPMATEPPVAEPTPTLPTGPSFETTTYRDETSGFEFDYPAGWFVGPIEQYSRGGITAFTSWERPTDVFPDETPPGETRLDATVQLWDPQGNLQAFVEQRMTAWEASGIGVLSQEEWTLSDGRLARSFAVAGADGAQGYFFFTTIGDNYLVLSGSGDLALLAEIAHTVRPLSAP
ncbi:MAG TPA: hypothetical protein VJJ46_09875 [Anaerolineales bacterium]|nr:hypothetical protein [Anaerolineales bacterium]